MRKETVSLVLAYVFIFYATLNADTIYLKNGRSIEGIIKDEDNEIINLEVYGGSVKFRKSEIEKIEKGSPEDENILRKNWEKQKIENQNKILRQQLEEEHKPRELGFSQDRQSIILNVTLNKKVEAFLILDTGASLVTLRKNIAKKLGIDMDRVKPDTTARLADGRQVNAKRIILESIKVENVEADNVEASILLDDVGGADFNDGLLGMSFLKRFNFKVDYKDKKLILEKL
jgi:clan AA aspartic protease (TIGR02281 family)